MLCTYLDMKTKITWYCRERHYLDMKNGSTHDGFEDEPVARNVSYISDFLFGGDRCRFELGQYFKHRNGGIEVGGTSEPVWSARLLVYDSEYSFDLYKLMQYSHRSIQQLAHGVGLPSNMLEAEQLLALHDAKLLRVQRYGGYRPYRAKAPPPKLTFPLKYGRRIR